MQIASLPSVGLHTHYGWDDTVASTHRLSSVDEKFVKGYRSGQEVQEVGSGMEDGPKRNDLGRRKDKHVGKDK